MLKHKKILEEIAIINKCNEIISELKIREKDRHYELPKTHFYSVLHFQTGRWYLSGLSRKRNNSLYPLVFLSRDDVLVPFPHSKVGPILDKLDEHPLYPYRHKQKDKNQDDDLEFYFPQV